MSTADDQIASLLAAAGAADVLDKRVASHRERARAVLRRQAERIARLEHLLGSLRQGPLPAAGSLPPAAPPAEITGLLRDLLKRQEVAEKRQQEHQEQLLAALGRSSASAAPGSAELTAPLAEMLKEFRREQLDAARQAEQRWHESLHQQAQRLEAFAHDHSAQAQQQQQLLGDLKQTLTAQPASSQLAAQLREQLEPCLADITQRLELHEKQREQHAAELRRVVEELRSQPPAGDSQVGVVAETLRELATQQQATAAAQQRDLARQSELLSELGKQLATVKSASADNGDKGVLEAIEQLAHDLAARAEAQAATQTTHDASLEQILAELHQQNERLAQLTAANRGDEAVHALLQSVFDSQQRSEQQHAARGEQQLAALAALREQLEQPDATADEQQRVLEKIVVQLDAQRELLASSVNNEHVQKLLETLAANQQRALEQHAADQEHQRTAFANLAARLEPTGDDPVRDGLAALATRIDEQHQQHVEQAKKMAAALAKLHSREAHATQKDQLEIARALTELADRQQKAEAARRESSDKQSELLSQLERRLAEVSDDRSRAAADAERSQMLASIAAQLESQQREQAARDARLLELSRQLGELTAAATAPRPETEAALRQWGERYENLQQEVRTTAEQQTEILRELKEQVALSNERSGESDAAAQLVARWNSFEAARAQLDSQLREALADLQVRTDAAALTATADDVAPLFQELLARQAETARQLQEQREQQQRLITELHGQTAQNSEGTTELAAQLAAHRDATQRGLDELAKQLRAAEAERQAREAEQCALLGELRTSLASPTKASDEAQQDLLQRMFDELTKQAEQRQAHDAEWDLRLEALCAEQQREGERRQTAEGDASVSITTALEQLAAAQQQRAEAHAAELAELRALVTNLRDRAPDAAGSEPLGDIVSQIEELRATINGALPRSNDADSTTELLKTLAEQHQAAERQRREDQKSLAESLARLADRPATESGAVAPDAAAVSKLLDQFAEQQMAAEERQTEAQRQLTRTLAALQSQVEDLAQNVRAAAGGGPLGFPRADSRAGRTAPKETTISPSLGWEEAKQRLLAQLESESDDDQGAAAYGDASDESGATDEGSGGVSFHELSSRADEEIAELRRQLEALQQAAEASSVVDKDELVQQERERLRVLQDEWQEKLRKAEIDISIERAKLARERTRLEEQLQTLQQERGDGSPEDGNGKAGKNRWLARLGLLENQE